MANYKTGAQRYNDRMNKIFEEAKRLNKKHWGTEYPTLQDVEDIKKQAISK